MYHVDESKFNRLRQANEILERAAVGGEQDARQIRKLLSEDARLIELLNAVDDLLK